MNSESPLLLIVEDDPDIAETLTLLLNSEGFRVAEVNDGLQAMEKLKAGLRPGLILLDLNMPVMDGRTFCLRRQSEPALDDIPIVLLSAYDDVGGSSLEALHVVGHVKKPYDLDRLIALVRQHCVRS